MKQFDDKIQQQIEAYLNQDMTDLERSRFEKQLHQDPELHEEVEFQESMLEAIRAERMVALKAGLNQVSISMWSTGLLEAAKIAAISMGIGLAGFGGYTYYQSLKGATVVQTVDSLQTNLPVVAQVEESPSSSAEAAATTDSPNADPAQTEATPAVTFTPNAGNAQEPAAASPAGTGRRQVNRNEDKANETSVPAQVADAETREPGVKQVNPSVNKDINLPEDGITKKSSLESVHPEVVIKRDNKDKFHYQFSDSKLILYADFSDKLYEVLELNQQSEKQLFFAYDNRFFYLDPSQTEISPLKEVKDKNLVQVLTAYQKRRN